MTKVKMVIGQFHPLVGGAEIQCHRLSRALQERGVQIQVITLRYPSLSKNDLVGHVPVRRITAPHLAFGHQHYFVFYSWLLALGSYLIRHRGEYDLLHVHQIYGHTAAAVWAGQQVGVPVLAKVGNSGHRFDPHVLAAKHPLGSLLAKFVRDRLAAAIATSKLMLDELEDWGVPKNRLHLIPNGVSLPPACSQKQALGLRQRLQVDSNTWVLSFVGSLLPKKNVPVLLDAFARLVRKRSQAHLWILGDGPQRRLLKQQAARLGLTGKLTFVGQVPNVADYLAASDAFVLPSRIEGMSNALLEAMSHGLPCVATNVGGNPDLIHSGENGWLVPPDDSSALYEALEHVLNNPDAAHAAGRAARVTMAERFSIDRVADAYIDLYDHLLKKSA